MKRTWTIHPKQRVKASLNRDTVYFQHFISKTSWRGLTLSWNQFQNMNDVLRDWKTFRNIQHHPLGEEVWLCCYNPVIRLEGEFSYFQFNRDSWKKYIRRVHHKVYSFFRHGISRHENYQHHATNESRSRNASRKSRCNSERYKALPRTSRNATHEDEQWKKSTNLSERDYSDSGRNFSFRRSVNVLRSKASFAEEDCEDGELSDDKSDFEEYSSVCAIE